MNEGYEDMNMRYKMRYEDKTLHLTVDCKEIEKRKKKYDHNRKASAKTKASSVEDIFKSVYVK